MSETSVPSPSHLTLIWALGETRTLVQKVCPESRPRSSRWTKEGVNSTYEERNYTLNCVPTKFTCWSPNSQDLRMWLYLESWLLKRWLEASQKTRPIGQALIQSDQYPYKKRKFGLRHADTQRQGLVKTQGKDSHLQAKERGIGRNQSRQCLCLELASRTVTKLISLVFGYGSSGKLIQESLVFLHSSIW